MAESDLKKYIRTCLKKGIGMDKIQKTLSEQGFSSDDVENAYREIFETYNASGGKHFFEDWKMFLVIFIAIVALFSILSLIFLWPSGEGDVIERNSGISGGTVFENCSSFDECSNASVLRKDYSYCEKLESERVVGLCKIDAGIEMDDLDVCESLKDNKISVPFKFENEERLMMLEMINYCYLKFAMGGEDSCNMISNEEAKRLCSEQF